MSSKIINNVVISAFSRFPVKLIYYIAFKSALSAFSLPEYI